jgi:cobalamin biosynthesis protein CobD/CbiB
MKITEFLTKMVCRNSGVSSKRVCGVFGWIVCLFIAIFATISSLSVPAFLDTVIITSAALLGVDCITNIFNKNN